MSEGRNFALQSLTVFLTKLFMLGSGVLATAIIARALGPAGLGIYTAIFAVITIILTIADLGIRQAVTFTMAKQCYSDQDIVSSLLFILLFSSAISIVVTLFVFLTGPAWEYGWSVVMPALASIPCLLMIAYTRGVSLAKGWIAKFNFADISQKLVFLGALLLFMWLLELGTLGATLGYFVAALVTALYSWNLLRRVARPVPRYSPAPAKALLSIGITYAAVLFVLNLNYRIDIILLERLSSADQVGLYAVGVRFAEMIWQIPAALGVVLFSRSAQSVVEEESLRRAARVLRLTLPVIVGICVALYLLAPWILRTVFGSEFEAAASATRYLLPGIASAVVFKVLYSDLAGRGKPMFALWIFSAVACVNIGLNMWLIPRMGIDGAALASTVSYLIGAVVFLGLYVRAHKLPVRDMVLLTRDDVVLINSRLGRFRSRLSQKSHFRTEAKVEDQ